MSKFSQDNITAVLMLLPGKSLLRFKCVSKAFCSEIEDPNFAEMHLRKSMETKTHLNLILDERSFGEQKLLCVANLESRLFQPIQIFFSPSGQIGLSDLCCCRGLFFFFDPGVLWNPSTRRYKIIPPCPGLEMPESSFEFHYVTYVGFGYDSARDDYQIVRLLMKVVWPNDEPYSPRPETRRPIWSDFQVWVYSLKSNSWMKIETSTNLFISSQVLHPGVFADGALHWVLGTNYNSTDQKICTFDLATKKFGRLPLPDELPNDGDHKGVILRLYNLGGRLSCMVIWERYQYDVYDDLITVELNVIEKRGDGMEVSWNKLFRVTDEEVPVFRSWREHVKLLAVSKTGNKFLLCDDGLPSYIWFDPKENTVENVIVHDMPSFCCSIPCWESLVDLGSGSENRLRLEEFKSIFEKEEEEEQVGEEEIL